LEFLHVYHHTLTMLLCYTQLEGQTSVQWIPIVLNLTVHVLMYYYYAISSLGTVIWWKKYLTTMQIIQFVLDLVVSYYCTYEALFNDCSGGIKAAFFGDALLSSYLLLFLSFYQKTYTKGKSAKKVE